MSFGSTGARQRLREMMRRQQVDLLEFYYDKAGATLSAAEGACEYCESVDACIKWLRSESSTSEPRFCPNSQLLERFKAT